MKKIFFGSLGLSFILGQGAFVPPSFSQTNLPPTQKPSPAPPSSGADDISEMIHQMSETNTFAPLTERVGVKTNLKYTFPTVMTEGKKLTVRIELENAQYLPAESFPIKGNFSFSDQPYDLSTQVTRNYAFEIPVSGVVDVPLLFYTPGKKTVKLQSESPFIPAANLLVDIKPFKATIFPQAVDTSKFEPNPQYWNVYVNLNYSGGNSPQRQYYLVTYKNEIVQRLLTSAAAPGGYTPHGRFKLGAKMVAPRSTKYDSVMPFWSTIQIPGKSFEYGNHGLLGESYLYQLGAPASHGCVRLSNKDVRINGIWTNIGGAKWVYSHVPLNTPIHIFNRRAPQPFVFENYAMWLARQ